MTPTHHIALKHMTETVNIDNNRMNYCKTQNTISNSISHFAKYQSLYFCRTMLLWIIPQYTKFATVVESIGLRNGLLLGLVVTGMVA